MTEQINEHVWFEERMAAQLAGGLAADEAERFGTHAAGCARCSGVMDQLRRFDAALVRSFDPHRADGIEERVISRLGRIPARKRLLRLPHIPQMKVHPMVRRAGSAVAAAIIMGAIGYVAEPALTGGQVHLPQSLAWLAPSGDKVVMVKAAANVRSIDALSAGGYLRDRSETWPAYSSFSGYPIAVDQSASAAPGSVAGYSLNPHWAYDAHAEGFYETPGTIAGQSLDAKVPVNTGRNPSQIADSQQVITQIMPLQNIPSGQIASELKPSLSPGAVVTSNNGANVVIVTDTSHNIKRAAELIEGLDRPSALPNGANNLSYSYAAPFAIQSPAAAGFKLDGTIDPTFALAAPAANQIDQAGRGGRGGGGGRGGTSSLGSTALTASDARKWNDNVTLGGNNTYTGATTVSGGMLQLQSHGFYDASPTSSTGLAPPVSNTRASGAATFDTSGDTLYFNGGGLAVGGPTKAGSGTLALGEAAATPITLSVNGPPSGHDSNLGWSSNLSFGNTSATFGVPAGPTYFQPATDAQHAKDGQKSMYASALPDVAKLAEKESATSDDLLSQMKLRRGAELDKGPDGIEGGGNDIPTDDSLKKTTDGGKAAAGLGEVIANGGTDTKKPDQPGAPALALGSGPDIANHASAINESPADLARVHEFVTGAVAKPSDTTALPAGQTTFTSDYAMDVGALNLRPPSATTTPPANPNATNSGKPATGGGAPAQPAAQPPAPAQRPAQQQAAGPIIIRNGSMEFEVPNFEVAVIMIQSVITNEGGYIATNDSQKLANGKMQGSVTLRVPPQNLDDLVIKLRPLGDIKGQKIAAQDITKDYTDLQSELRAAEAMQDRLIDDIKNGKGEMKDLVAAEQQLGQWREKIEQITGEILYYNNLVGMATLTVTMTEKDIAAAVSSAQTQTIDAGLEADDVSATRDAVLKLIDDAKGQVISSDMKQLDAGQFAATVVAQVPPDAAGAMIDQIRAFKNSKVARLEVTRQTTTSGPTGEPVKSPTIENGNGIASPDKVERKAAVFNLSIYNLANVAPRVTNVMSLVCTDDVETVYHSILDGATKAGGRVVGSSLNRPKPEQVSASISIEVPAAGADGMLASIRGMGQVMHLTETENPDTANVTTAKRGFNIQVASWSSVQPREIRTRSIAATPTVHDSYAAVLAAAQTAGARVLAASEQGQTGSAAASLDLEVTSAKADAIESAIGQAGIVTSSQEARNTDTENSLDGKVEVKVTFVDMAALAPRQTMQRMIAADAVPAAYNAILSAAQTAGARVFVSQLNDLQAPLQRADLKFQVLRSREEAVDAAISKAGQSVTSQVVRADEQANTVDAKVEIDLVVVDAQALPPRQTTTIDMIASDPAQSAHNLRDAARAAGGRIVADDPARTTDGIAIEHLVVDFPAGKVAMIGPVLDSAGSVKSEQVSTDGNAPQGPVERSRIDATIHSQERLVAPEAEFWPTLKNGLATSLLGLGWSVKIIIIGLLLAGPWALVVWGGIKGVARLRRKKTPPAP